MPSERSQTDLDLRRRPSPFPTHPGDNHKFNYQAYTYCQSTTQLASESILCYKTKILWLYNHDKLCY
ncbi:hypothetical protein QCA50_004257 [Cerrena zonata]|uniref:Uncharacterized protein n=1 Tax=Cerrena zonata TaxID=2478898 RepID=A0AAW0GLE4_9APHY